jgi:A/G-specific adenine glycosylase
MVADGEPDSAAGPDGHFSTRLLEWGSTHRRDFPWRGPTNRFHLLIAELLLQRSRGSSAVSVYERLISRWPTPQALASANARELTACVRPLGLVTRSETLRALAAEIVRLGDVPDSEAGLRALPRIGPYVAAAVLSQAGETRPAVDSVSARVYRRYFGLDPGRGQRVDDTLWRLVEQVTPKGVGAEFNWAVLDLAATICLPKRPKCDECPLSSGCKHRSLVAANLQRPTE